MADQSPSDRPVDSGASDGQSKAADAGPPQILRLAEADQDAADRYQNASDTDQTTADSDQASADRDQEASDLDQAASDLDAADGVEPQVHDLTSEIRRRGTEQRHESAQARLLAAGVRDENACARDLSARARDQDAVVRDLLMAARDEGDEQFEGSRALTGAEVVVRCRAAQTC